MPDISENPMNDVYFLNRYKGWAVAGGGGELWFTNDGGFNWELNHVGYNENLQSVFFLDSLKGFVCGSSGLLLKTTDGGISWEKYITNTPNTLNCIKFVNEYIGWIVGNGGIILKTTNGGSTFVEDYQKKFPSSYSLSQNYPNPFNPATNIGFRIANFGFVSLKVYDVLGREVASLVNEEKPAGEYEVEFDASGLSSGIYFYKLQTENYSLTKKMIYLK